jgi:hypothetical protein
MSNTQKQAVAGGIQAHSVGVTFPWSVQARGSIDNYTFHAWNANTGEWGPGRNNYTKASHDVDVAYATGSLSTTWAALAVEVPTLAESVEKRYPELAKLPQSVGPNWGSRPPVSVKEGDTSRIDWLRLLRQGLCTRSWEDFFPHEAAELKALEDAESLENHIPGHLRPAYIGLSF